MGYNFFCLSIPGFWTWTGKNFVKNQPCWRVWQPRYCVLVSNEENQRTGVIAIDPWKQDGSGARWQKNGTLDCPEEELCFVNYQVICLLNSIRLC